MMKPPASASENRAHGAEKIEPRRYSDFFNRIGQQATSITAGGSVNGDRKLKESTPRLAPGSPQPSAVGFDDRAADC